MSRKSNSNNDDTSNEIMMISNEANLNSTSNIGGNENQNMEALDITSPIESADQSMSSISNQYHSFQHQRADLAFSVKQPAT